MGKGVATDKGMLQQGVTATIDENEFYNYTLG
jgi:hypothetical protein